MAKATSGKDVLATFFDEGVYTVLGACAQGAVKVAFGSADGQHKSEKSEQACSGNSAACTRPLRKGLAVRRGGEQVCGNGLWRTERSGRFFLLLRSGLFKVFLIVLHGIVALFRRQRAKFFFQCG